MGAARLWTGGTGEAIVLVHGGWGGAETHWSTIADDLAATHLVIAPELPGLGVTDEPPLAGFRDYAAWLRELLASLGVDRATMVGNALGATVAWCYASMFPERTANLVMLNGFPPPRYHTFLRGLARTGFLRGPARRQLSTHLYGPQALRLGFADRSAVPAEIEALLTDPPPARIEAILDLYLSGEPDSPPPDVPALIFFGEADRVPLFDRRAGRRFGKTLGNGRFFQLPGAGHLPQLEKPAEVLRELRRFLQR